MTMQTIPGQGFWLGRNFLTADVTQAVVIDAATEKFVVIFLAPESGEVSHIGFAVNAITDQPDNGLDIRLETVDLTNNPAINTGTLADTNSENVGYLAGALTTGQHLVALAATATVVKDTAYAIVIQFNSFVAGDSVTFASAVSSNTGRIQFPYMGLVTGTAWTTVADDIPNAAIQYSGSTIYPIQGMVFIASVAVENYNSASNPNRRGLRFKLPVKARLAGLSSYLDYDPAGFTAYVYDSDGIEANALWSIAIDKDLRAAAGSDTIHLTIPVSDRPILTANTFYRVAFLPTSGVDNLRLRSLSVTSASYLDWNAGGQNFHYTTANGAPTQEADWTQTLTKRPFIDLCFDQFDDGAGGGGGLLMANKRGNKL